MKDIINEIYGLPTNLPNFDRFNGRTGPGEFYSPRTINTQPLRGLIQQPSLWQPLVEEGIIRKQDQIISVPPAAGKTRPVKGAVRNILVNHINSLITSGEIHRFELDIIRKGVFPRFLFVVPTKQLAMEMYNQEFKPLLLEIIGANLSLFIPTITKSINDVSTLDEKRLLMTTVNRLIGLQIGGIPRDEYYYINRVPKLIVVATYKMAERIMREDGDWFQNVIVDEIQQLIPFPSVRPITKDVGEKINSLLTIVKNTPKSPTGAIQLMTGSVNKDTMQDTIIPTFNKYFGRNFTSRIYGNEATPINARTRPDGSVEYIGNRSRLTVVPYNKFSRGNNRIGEVLKLITEKVIEKDPWNVMVLFSNKEIKNILNTLIDNLPPRDENIFYDDVKSVYGKSNNELTFNDYISMQSSDRVFRTPLPESVINSFRVKRENNLLLRVTNKPPEFNENEKFIPNRWQFFLYNDKGDPVDFIYAQPGDTIVLSRDIVKNPDGIAFFNIVSINKNLIIVEPHPNDRGKITISDELIKSMDWEVVRNNIRSRVYLPGSISGNTRITDDIEFLKYFDEKEVFTRAKEDDQEVETDKDGMKVNRYNPNNLLFRCVKAGIGFMIGGMHNRHKGIIQKLFRDKKIYFLLATDSLGVGANVLCRNLYIPNLDKVNINTFGKLDDSTLVQLINRAGRDANKIPVSFIHVPQDDYERVKEFITRDPAVRVSPLEVNFSNSLSHASDVMSKNDIRSIAKLIISDGYDD